MPASGGGASARRCRDRLPGFPCLPPLPHRLNVLRAQHRHGLVYFLASAATGAIAGLCGLHGAVPLACSELRGCVQVCGARERGIELVQRVRKTVETSKTRAVRCCAHRHAPTPAHAMLQALRLSAALQALLVKGAAARPPIITSLLPSLARGLATHGVGEGRAASEGGVPRFYKRVWVKEADQVRRQAVAARTSARPHPPTPTLVAPACPALPCPAT